MVEVIERLLGRLDQLLRYVAPGLVGLVALAVVHPSAREWVRSPDAVWMLLLGAALMGVTTYAIATGAVLPHLWKVILLIRLGRLKDFGWLKKDLAWLETVSEWLKCDYPSCLDKRPIEYVEFHMCIERWLRRHGDGKAKQIQEYLDKWAMMLNFTWCTGFILIALPFLSWMFLNPQGEGPWVGLFFTGIAVSLSAFFSDLRITRFELWLAKEFPQHATTCSSDEALVEDVLATWKAGMDAADVDQIMETYSETFSNPEVHDKASLREFLEGAISMGHLKDASVFVDDAQTTFEITKATIYPIDFTSADREVTIKLTLAKEQCGWMITGMDIEGL